MLYTILHRTHTFRSQWTLTSLRMVKWFFVSNYLLRVPSDAELRCHCINSSKRSRFKININILSILCAKRCILKLTCKAAEEEEEEEGPKFARDARAASHPNLDETSARFSELPKVADDLERCCASLHRLHCGLGRAARLVGAVRKASRILYRYVMVYGAARIVDFFNFVI